MRVSGLLQTGVHSQPEDRCALLCPGLEPMCVCPSCALASVGLVHGVGVVRGGACREKILRAGLCPRSPGVGGRLWVGSRLACAWCALASRLGLCGRLGWSFTRPFSPGTLRAPAVSRRGVGGGCEPADCASRPGCLYFKTCCPLRARQLWVCSMLLLTAAAVGATQPSAAKMRLGPLPLQRCTGWPGLQ